MTNNLVKLVNQFFEIKSKIADMDKESMFERNFNRVNNIFEEENFVIHDPTGESYSESRTDCEANIVGRIANKMRITKTLKPIIYQKNETGLHLIQKAVVIVE